MDILKRKSQKFTVDHLGFLVGIILIAASGMIWSSKYHAEHLMAERLELCGYVSHPIADVAWELVRRGQIPVGTAAFYSARMTSQNDHRTLKSCMSAHYPFVWVNPRLEDAGA